MPKLQPIQPTPCTWTVPAFSLVLCQLPASASQRPSDNYCCYTGPQNCPRFLILLLVPESDIESDLLMFSPHLLSESKMTPVLCHHLRLNSDMANSYFVAHEMKGISAEISGKSFRFVLPYYNIFQNTHRQHIRIELPGVMWMHSWTEGKLYLQRAELNTWQCHMSSGCYVACSAGRLFGQKHVLCTACTVDHTCH